MKIKSLKKKKKFTTMVKECWGSSFLIIPPWFNPLNYLQTIFRYKLSSFFSVNDFGYPTHQSEDIFTEGDFYQRRKFLIFRKNLIFQRNFYFYQRRKYFRWGLLPPCAILMANRRPLCICPKCIILCSN